MRFVVSLLYSLILVSVGVESARILALFTSPSPSHLIVHTAVTNALAEQGHEVTVITSIPLREHNPKVNHFIISPNEFLIRELDSAILKMSRKDGLLDNALSMYQTMKTITDFQYDIMFNERFQKKISSQKFDLIVIGYFSNDFLLAVASQLKIPVVLVWSGPPGGSVNTYIGNPSESSYVPNIMAEAIQPMSFMDRVGEFLINGVFYGLEEFVNFKFSSYYDEYVQEFNLKDMPSFDDMRKNVSLVFCNSHFSEGPIRPNVPAIVEIGGIQIKDKPDPLEPKLKEFLDNSSKHGAILFSMGSNVKVSTLDPKIIKTLYNVFSKLKQNVLWKWEDPNPASFPGNSKNILFSKWIPQDDVLAHKNMKLFVTHGGKGSVVESQYHGIPMIGLPVFGDQPGNIDKIVKVGYGLKLDYKTMTEQELSTAVNEVLNNPSYAANVKKFADTYKDRPLSARESVVFWTEYVIRHHGAPHLQSPLVHMNVIQQYSIDVLAVIFGALYIVYRISKLCICFVWRKVFGKKCKSKAKAKKSKKE
ncbi:Ugt37b1 family protein [Megaselia abdita]